MYQEIKQCRISQSRNLIPVLNLGHQYLTGVFPRSKTDELTCGPLEVVWCPDSGLLQLRHSYSLDEMYGQNYGYRSGLNQSMVRHLSQKVNHLTRIRSLSSGNIVLDIGSNDGTLLNAYPDIGLQRIGIDPTADKFRQYYPESTVVDADFFSAEVFRRHFPNGRAQIVTSIAMFYDLEDPTQFVGEIASILADDGIWHFEQSYMPSMLRMNAYDTICHEHLEYYSLGVVERILAANGLKLIDVQMNAVNGGSFAVTAAKSESRLRPNQPIIDWLMSQEERMGLSTPRPFRQFEERVFEHRRNLIDLIRSLNSGGKRILGYGASTKGNVLLQFCGLTEADLPAIAEVNTDKFGCFTPGTGIPIVSEEDAKAMKPDYFLVLPWHFKENIIQREQDFINNGGKLIFPLPEIEIY